MKRNLSILISLLVVANMAWAQQDPMFTKYMFNSLAFNPAYAGSNEHLSLGLLARNQWYSFKGAPESYSLTAHTPMKNERVGLGFSMIHDEIGPTRTTGANVSYAYRIPVGKNGAKLSIGLQGGFQNFYADFTQVDKENPIDPAFANRNITKPNFGAGLYYYSKKFYFGVGVPHLIEWNLRSKTNVPAGSYVGIQSRHYFFHTGGAIPLNGDALVFKPSILVRNAGLLSKLNKDNNLKNINAPTSANLDLSLLFYQKFWLGAAYSFSPQQFGGTTSANSVNLWTSYNLENGMRIGLAYDYAISRIQSATVGSFELFLGYEFDYKTKKVATPRYF
jgi:type IX secretion system PorP/SprF family membrane protein